jgi:hypothetical protein
VEHAVEEAVVAGGGDGGDGPAAAGGCGGGAAGQRRVEAMQRGAVAQPANGPASGGDIQGETETDKAGRGVGRMTRAAGTGGVTVVGAQLPGCEGAALAGTV